MGYLFIEIIVNITIKSKVLVNIYNTEFGVRIY